MVISIDNPATTKLGFAKGVLLKKATAHTAKLPKEREAARGQTEGLSK